MCCGLVCGLVGWTPLHEASNHGRVTVARELLRAGADSNAQGLDNNSPLHDAAINGHVEVSTDSLSLFTQYPRHPLCHRRHKPFCNDDMSMSQL